MALAIVFAGTKNFGFVEIDIDDKIISKYSGDFTLEEGTIQVGFWYRHGYDYYDTGIKKISTHSYCASHKDFPDADNSYLQSGFHDFKGAFCNPGRFFSVLGVIVLWFMFSMSTWIDSVRIKDEKRELEYLYALLAVTAVASYISLIVIAGVEKTGTDFSGETSMKNREDMEFQYFIFGGPVPEETVFFPEAEYGNAFIVLCVMFSILFITFILEFYDRFNPKVEYESYGLLR